MAKKEIPVEPENNDVVIESVNNDSVEEPIETSVNLKQEVYSIKLILGKSYKSPQSKKVYLNNAPEITSNKEEIERFSNNGRFEVKKV